MPAIERSVPYPWPYDAPDDEPLGTDRLALLCVGVQASFAAATVGADAIAMTIGLLARALRGAGAKVIVVTVGSRPLLPHARSTLVPGAPEPPDPLLAGYADLTLNTAGIDAFFASPLEVVLRDLGRDRLALCGFGAETAVDSTLRSANDRGFECLTLVDAVAPHSPYLSAHAHSSITMSGGIFGAIATSTDLLAALGPLPRTGDTTTDPVPGSDVHQEARSA